MQTLQTLRSVRSRKSRRKSRCVSKRKRMKIDQFRFNAKIQDTTEEAKAAVQVNALDKVKDSLQKGENLLKERQKHILLADKSEYGWSTVRSIKRARLRMILTMRRKCSKPKHTPLSASRSRTGTSGFAPRKASVAQDSGPNHSDERYTGLRRIPTVDSQSRIRVRPGNCFQCGKPSHWRGQCPTFHPKPNTSF